MRKARAPWIFAALSILGACEPTSAPRVRTWVGDWRDRVVYQIVTDRFANGDESNDAADGVSPVPGDLSRMQGGDFRGITEHLDYIEALGANAIWISPIVANVPRIESSDGYHGYWPSDFTTINPRFGTLEELQVLVASAHARDIAVIVDIVPNHAGRVFAYDLDEDGVIDPGEDEPPYRAEGYSEALVWHTAPPRLFAPMAPGELEPRVMTLGPEHFHRRGIGALGDFEERRYGDFPSGLRDLDTERDDVIEALIETYVRWVLLTDVDGYRIDAVPHVELEFWVRFCRGLRERLAAEGKERFLLLGEAFEFDPAEIARHTDEDMLDAGFDFPFWGWVVSRVLFGGDSPALARTYLEDARAEYRSEPQPLGIGLDPWQARFGVVDSHDISRIRGVIDDPFAADVALVALFGLDAIPVVYYGTEQEFRGVGPHDRREVLWTSGFAQDQPAFALLRRLAELRRAHAALRYGSLRVRYAAEVGGAALEDAPPDAGLLIWERDFEGEHVLVALSAHPTRSARARFEVAAPAGTRWVDALAGGPELVVDASQQVELTLPPRRAYVLVPVR